MDSHLTAKNELRIYLKENYSNLDLFESCKKVSANWNNREPKTDEDFNSFYKKEVDYIYEISNWSSTWRRKRLFWKLYGALRQNGIKSVLDFGAGIGSDSIGLHYQDIKVKYLEINNLMIDFFKFRCKEKKIEIPIIEKLENSECIMFVDVIEHFNNPIEYLKRFSKHSKALLFTQSFGEHDEARGGMPYHQDFKMKDINKFLVMLGYTKIKLDIVIPPYFYRR